MENQSVTHPYWQIFVVFMLPEEESNCESDKAVMLQPVITVSSTSTGIVVT